MSQLEKLERMYEDVQRSKQEIASYQGARKEVVKQLQDHGCKDIKAVDAKLKQLTEFIEQEEMETLKEYKSLREEYDKIKKQLGGS